MSKINQNSQKVKFTPVPTFKESPFQFIYCKFCEIYWTWKEYLKLRKYSVAFVLLTYFINNRIQDSVASINLLEKNKIKNIYQLKKAVDYESLHKIKQIGRKRFYDIRFVLEEFLNDLQENEKSCSDLKFWKYKKEQKKELKERGVIQ